MPLRVAPGFPSIQQRKCTQAQVRWFQLRKKLKQALTVLDADFNFYLCIGDLITEKNKTLPGNEPTLRFHTNSMTNVHLLLLSPVRYTNHNKSRGCWPKKLRVVRLMFITVFNKAGFVAVAPSCGE